jgi:Catalase
LPVTFAIADVTVTEEAYLSWNPRSKRAVIGLVVILALGYYLFRPSPPGPMGEEISPDEDYLTAQIVASALSMVNMSQQYSAAHPLPGYPPRVAASGVSSTPGATSAPYRRDVHSKTHGCIKAKFTVVDNLDSRFRYGLFADTQPHEAWIRFSSGKEYPQPDSDRDARGMAIKVMGVKGPKLLDEAGLKQAETQDFPLMNATQFFIRNIEEYNEFTKYLGSGMGARANYGYFFGGFSPDPRKWQLREFWLGMKTQKPAPDSLLNTQFYSVSAYKLGPSMNVKYSAKPCNESPAAGVNRSDPNFLRLEMVKRLAGTGKACFEFLVQPQVAGKNMPVEDTTVEWPEKDSPFIPVAHLEIAPQQFEQNNDVCENLSFSPWHSLPEHRPIGVMNRIRKAVYLEVSRYRREKNGAALCEPSGFDDTTPVCEPVQPTGAGNTVTAPQAAK